MKLSTICLLTALVSAACNSSRLSLPADHLATEAGRAVDPDDVLAEYPRPELVREKWESLNGYWEFATATAGEDAPIGRALNERILVPFGVESVLSGIGRHVDRAWYRRTFSVPKSWAQRRVILHFGAVDWEARVWVNGHALATHRGGYDPFDVDVTPALKAPGPQELVVGVFDPTSDGDQPRGKQVLDPKGIEYTPTTGIWQSVWIEPVAKTHLAALEFTPNLARGTVSVLARVEGGEPNLRVKIRVLAGHREVGAAEGRPDQDVEVALSEVHAWSPDDPFLYDVDAVLEHSGKVFDVVKSYFGLRSIEAKADAKGVPRLYLNGEPCFQMGVLDQGFWPDGLYTAPTDAALRADIELVKKLGFNTIRKHVKVEPARWYRWCDELGVLVWQDMPSGRNESGEGKLEFESELARIVRALKSHPSIVMWVVFNEGWGQHDTERLTAVVKHLDPTRLVSNASGWTDAHVGDIVDVHVYPGPGAPKIETARAAVLGEFGGLGLGIPGHTWESKTWGYRGVADANELTDGYVDLLTQVWQLQRDSGLAAAIYTQLTDVETECNGLVTYDRAVVKVDVARVAAANRGRVPAITMLVPSAKDSPVRWRYVLDQVPDDAWTRPDFEDTSWTEGVGGFGTPGTPGAVASTLWNVADIRLRRAFTLDAALKGDVRLSIHHDEDAEVWINGVLAAKLTGYTTGYSTVRIAPEARAALVPGRNVIAIHCHQTTGGQYIDAGLVRVGD